MSIDNLDEQTVEQNGTTIVSTTVYQESEFPLATVPRPAYAEVDFGTSSSDAVTTVLCQGWTTVDSRLGAFFSGDTDDHDAADAGLEGLTVVVDNVVPGVSFDVVAHAPNSNTFGKYAVHIVGV